MRIDSLEALSTQLRSQLDTGAVAYQRERAQLQEHYAATERHWLNEVDRVRQAAKDVAQQHERVAREWLQQQTMLQAERDQLRHELMGARDELQRATAVRQRLEVKLRLRPDLDQPRNQGSWRRAGLNGRRMGSNTWHRS
jgi:hypothetical protein